MITFQRVLSKNFKLLRSITGSSSALSSKKDEDSKEEKKPTKEEVSTKLNELLKFMIENEGDQPKSDLKLAQAVKRKREKPEKKKPLGEQLAGAAKEVAKSLGADVEKTESELLNILLRPSETGTLNDVLKGIQVMKDEKPMSRAQQVRSSLAQQEREHSQLSVTASFKWENRKPRTKSAVHVDLLAATPSSYFKDLKPQPTPCELQTWQNCVARDMRLAVTHPPANIYEQMILWSDRGMLWHFPIDNEQGLDKEKQVSFEEHIFLENHLEGWCPDRGPVRHFMELVCVGLSKNHWLSVEEKKEHIFWYRDYFADKKALLQEIGAGTINFDRDEKRELFKPIVKLY